MEHSTQVAVTVREANAVDLPAVLRLYAQPDLDDGQTLSLEEARAIFDRFSWYPNYRLFVASIEGGIVGTYALLIMDNLAHRGAKSAIVEDVVVLKSARSQGVGTAMMRHAMQRAMQADCYKLTLSSNQKRDAAHAFYESIGFVRHGFSFLVEPQHA
jgi:GNAT superfamily N-acetyltransferase